jgi:hypothetical protein
MKKFRTVLTALMFLVTLSSCECIIMALAGIDCNTGEDLYHPIVAAIFDMPQAPPPGSNNNERGAPIHQEIVGPPTSSEPGGNQEDPDSEESSSFANIISQPTFLLGPSMSWLGGDKEEGEKFPARPGFQMGAIWHVPLTDRLNLEPGLQYANRGVGYKSEESGYYEPGVTTGGSYSYGQRKKLHYLELPIFVSGQVANRLELFAGPQVGFLMAAKIVNESNGKTTSTEKGTKGLNKVDLGLSAGARYQIPNSFFSVSLGYYHGLSNLSSGSEYGGYGYDEPKYFTRAARLGVQYNFPQAKKHNNSGAVKKSSLKSWVAK